MSATPKQSGWLEKFVSEQMSEILIDFFAKIFNEDFVWTLEVI